MTETTDGPAPPAMRFAFRLELDFDRAFTFPSHSGERGFLRASGGRVSGPLLTGKVTDHGGDWPVYRPDGVVELEARLIIEADDGEYVYMRNRGTLRLEPGEMAAFNAGEKGAGGSARFLCAPQFDTAAGPHDALTRAIFVGSGSLSPDRMTIDIFEFLQDAP